MSYQQTGEVFRQSDGPAIKGGCVTRRQHRAESWYFSQKIVTVQGGYGTCFCRPGTNFIEHYECRGTSLIGAANLSPVAKLVAGTGAIAVQALEICLGCRSKSKKCDKQLTFIVRVISRPFLIK